jgi:hypothetical protein
VDRGDITEQLCNKLIVNWFFFLMIHSCSSILS